MITHNTIANRSWSITISKAVLDEHIGLERAYRTGHYYTTSDYSAVAVFVRPISSTLCSVRIADVFYSGGQDSGSCTLHVAAL